jgi:succinate dehydrogenase / fumarate reductase flavoprotein subunit
VSIHGANRLGGNSLADIMVFGKCAGIGASDYAQGREPGGDGTVTARAEAWEARFAAAVARSGGPAVASIRDRLAATMWYKVGIFRRGAEMEEAREVIAGLAAEYERCTVGDDSRIFNTAFVNYVELGNLLTVAKAAVLGALDRTESRGCHLREDYPARDDVNFLKHTLVSLQGSEYELSYRPVVVTEHQPAERRY